jgi:two-component system NarL family sensor kinase
MVVVAVEDDGRGLHPGARASAVQQGHLGLASIEERVEALGGRVLIESSFGNGTQVRVTIPAETQTRGDSASVSQNKERG